MFIETILFSPNDFENQDHMWSLIHSYTKTVQERGNTVRVWIAPDNEVALFITPANREEDS